MSPAKAALPTFPEGRRVVGASLGAFALGVILLGLGLLFDRERVAYSYLAAYAYAVSIAASALLFLMTGHAMRAGWPVPLRRLTEAMVSTLPLLAALFLPLLFGLSTLYPWLRPGSMPTESARRLLEHKGPYLNLPFFLVRTGLYFAVWITVQALLRRWSLEKDRAPDAAVNGKLTALSGGALPLVGIAMAFAAMDWLMSLSPLWYSTMYPIYYFAGGAVGAMALLSVLTALASRGGLLPGVGSSHYHALGRLLLTFTIFWAYCAFFQLLLIWIANKPDEVEFYLKRVHGPWQTVSTILVIAQFIVPFFLLLSYRLKRHPGPLTLMAVWLLVAHYLDVHWLTVPEAQRGGFPYHLADLGALLAIGGASVAFAALRLRGQCAMPKNDPELPRGLRYESQ